MPQSAYFYPPPIPPPRSPLDRPFTLGGGIGFGGLSLNDGSGHKNAQDGMAYTFRLGFGLRPGLILMWDLEGTLVHSGYTSTSQTANLIALQVFASQRFFFKGGFGIAQVIQDDTPYSWGGAGMVGLGYELIQCHSWSFDIEATATAAHYNTNGNDQNWANWSLVNFAINFY